MELDLEEKNLHWELGVDRCHDGGTETLSRFNLYALTFLYLFVYLYHWFKK